MSIELIQERLLSYQCQTVLEQENALKEIAQEIALLALARSDFFKIAAFQGGTCLRILYNLQRFSEDLDFILLKPDPFFSWESYIRKMADEFGAYGYILEVTNRAELNKNVKSTFLKMDSVGGLLVIKDSRTNKPKLRIKLEIDTNPPDGATYDLKYLDFPMPYSITTQDLPSLFASKSHALLCRPYVKGRDWYDFIWYVSRKTPINFELLSNALNQKGPWEGDNISVSMVWFLQQLKDKIKQINWEETKLDVARFLNQREQQTLQLWSTDFFFAMVDRLEITELP